MEVSYNIVPNIRDFIVGENINLMIKTAEEIGTHLGILNAQYVLSIYRMAKSNLDQINHDSNSKIVLSKLHLIKPKVASILAKSGRGRPGLETLNRILISGIDLITEAEGQEGYRRSKNLAVFLEAIISYFQYAQKGGSKYLDDLEIKILQDKILNLQAQLDKLSQFISVSAKHAKVFLSHSHHDKPFVEKLKKKLEEKGIVTWYDDKDMDIGDIVSEAISEGIKQSWCFLIVVSPKSIASGWVKYELDEAYDDHIKKGKRILPVLIGDILDDQIPERLQKHLYADFRQGSDFEKSFERLYQTIIKEGSKSLNK